MASSEAEGDAQLYALQQEQYRADSLASILSESEATNRVINVNGDNLVDSKACGCLCRRQKEAFCLNKIVTSRYNLLTFFPLNLMKQFSQMANLYFLLLTCMECIPAISDSGGYPVLAFPLSFVVGLSMIKDIYEDYNRHQSDNEENKRRAWVLRRAGAQFEDQGETPEDSQALFVPTPWKEIKVGSIVKVHENEHFPCDLVILNSSLPKGICYVETKNLDGETNLKHKQADREATKLAENDYAVARNFSLAEIECEKENASIYSFTGMLKVKGQACPIDIDNVLLRGSSLRNTEWIYGVAVHTGHDTKVMMNSTKSNTKMSKIERSSNRYIVMTISIQAILSL